MWSKILEKLLPNEFIGYLAQKFPEWRPGVNRAEIKTKAWLNKLSTEIIKLAFLTVAIGLIYIVCLYYLRSIWHLFANTMVGSRFAMSVNPAMAAEISRVLALDLRFLGLTIMVLSLYVSLAAGVISQLVMLRRFFYIGRSFLIKLVWASVITAIVADKLGNYFPIDINLSFGLCFLPTMGIFSSVLVSAGRLLPELDLPLFIEEYRKRREIQDLKDDIARLMDDESE